MPLIKRYPNRKLYDTQKKRYITLGGIATLIREGEEIRVTDHVTGEDLTAVTLSQIIFEQEKRQAGFLPRSLLADLIQAGGNRLSTLRHTLVNSLGLSRLVDEEIERRVWDLVARDEVGKEEGARWLEKLLSFSPARRRPDERDIERVLAKQSLPTRDDLSQIVDQLDDLAAKMEALGAARKEGQG